MLELPPRPIRKRRFGSTLKGFASHPGPDTSGGLFQALIYLIDNAVESAGTEEPVDVVVESTRERVDVSVLDRGEGWPEIVRTHIGQPFLTTKPDGVGLGLYFVHTLIEAIGWLLPHGGSQRTRSGRSGFRYRPRFIRMRPRSNDP